MSCEIALFSNVGNSRRKQEDNAIYSCGRFLTLNDVSAISENRSTYQVKVLPTDKGNFIVAVSDGMGGHASGEVASGQVVKYLSDNYQRIIDGVYLNEQFLKDEISELNRTIVSYSRSDARFKGMGATLCGVICSKGLFYGFNVGDSRLYRYYDGELEQLSSDHTEGQRLVKLNLITERELSSFPRRKNLYKYIGINGELVADVFKIGNCVFGTTLLLCSDGLTDVIPDEELKEVLAKTDAIEEKGRLLVERALERNVGHGDNITLILVEF